ncbi:MAG TPA: S8 family serine peptidase [Acidimicrobiales bacterium]|nr:S8 family serine peptidase [Acidimicrobiales bacterium]
MLVVATSAVVAPTPIGHAPHADAGPAGPGADPPPLGPDDAASAWIDRAEAAASAAEATPPAAPKPIGGEPAQPPAEDANSLLVTFESDVPAAEAEEIVERAGAAAEPISGTDTVEVTAPGPALADVAAELTAEPEVEVVEPNRVRSASRVPNDTSYPDQQPYLSRIGAPAAWDVANTGAATVVAVLDTGVDLDHPDLAPNLVAGRDIVNGDADPSDDEGHGTAVAGVVGAATGNGGGVAGVAWNAKVMPVKVLGPDGTGVDADVASGITWATDHGADIINLSLGGPGASTVLEQAVNYALDHDVLVVAAAGNEATAEPSYPAAVPGVIAVTATDAQGRFAAFSNHGPWVILAAPGITIVTTSLAPGPVMATAPVTGTSFSSPIVAGVAALLRERHPGWAWDKVAYELIRTARDAGPAGVDDAYGFGLVDAAAALDVGPHGAVSAPSVTGDASDLPASPRLIPAGTAVTEGLGVELDQDWFAFDVGPAPAGASITVTPPPLGANRAAEMDPVVELYGPGGGLIATADAAGAGAPETIGTNLGPGRHLLKVANFAASVSPADYGLRVDLGAATGSPPPQGVGPWLAAATPAPHAVSVATTSRPSITFGRNLLGPSVTADTVLLLDGRTAAAVDASVSLAGRTVTVTPAGPLTPGAPYQIFLAGVQDAASNVAPLITLPFVTAPAGPPTYAVNGTYSPFSGDVDANGFDDIVWYAPGSAADPVWQFHEDGLTGVPTSVGGTYTTATGDFDGNGFDDILWYAPGTAADSIWFPGPSGITSQRITVNGTYTPVAADFDRNGFDDILWYGRGTIADAIWYFNASGLTSRATTVNGLYRPMAGDFNRDGFGDILWYFPGAGAEYLWFGGSAGFRSAAAPRVAGTYTTRVLDANGDGYDDVFWYAATTGSLWRGGSGGFTAQAGPAMPSGMRPVAGDFTGDGRDDLLAYVPGTAPDRLRPGTPTGIS